MVLALGICSPGLDKTILASTEHHLCLIIKAKASNDLFGMRSWQTDTVGSIKSPALALREMD